MTPGKFRFTIAMISFSTMGSAFLAVVVNLLAITRNFIFAMILGIPAARVATNAQGKKNRNAPDNKSLEALNNI